MADQGNDAERLRNANRRAWGLQNEVARLEGQLAARAGGQGVAAGRQSGDVPYNYNTVLWRLQGARAELSTSEPEVETFFETLEEKLMGIEGPEDPLNEVAGAYEPAAKRLKTLTGAGALCPYDLTTLLTPENVFFGKACNHMMCEASAVDMLAAGNNLKCGQCNRPFIDDDHLANIRRARAELEAKGPPDMRSPDEQLHELVAKQRIALVVRNGREVVELGLKAAGKKGDVDEAQDIVYFSIYTIKSSILKVVERPFSWDKNAKVWYRAPAAAA